MRIKHLKKKRLKCAFVSILLLSCLVYFLCNSSSLFEATLREAIPLQIYFNTSRDVLTFVHIQKTGGSDFDRNIVKNLLIQTDNQTLTRACQLKAVQSHQPGTTKKAKFKKYFCPAQTGLQNNWYFSRQTFGWACGLHADFNELSRCVPKFYANRTGVNFYYFTILRDPVKRTLSEWRHVARGATWKRRKLGDCQVNYEKCFNGEPNWINVTLERFLACEFSAAINRQTRMLATFDSEFNLCSQSNYLHGQLDSEGKVEFDKELLRRAKATLDSISFFALNEHQHLSELLFERLFTNVGFKFERQLTQSNVTISEQYYNDLEPKQLQLIKRLNYLDLNLYEYAKIKFFNKLRLYKIM